MPEIPINTDESQLMGEGHIPEQSGGGDPDQAGGMTYEGTPHDMPADESHQSLGQDEQSVDEAPDDAGRWDHDKAETLASVLTESGKYNQEVDNRQKRIDYINSDENINALTKDARKRLENSENRLKDATENDEPNAASVKLWTELRDGNQTDLDEKVAEIREDNEGIVERTLEGVNKGFDQKLSPYEELYDLNPDHFANMPTSEFMKLGEDFREIRRELRQAAENGRYVADSRDAFNARYEKKQLVSHRDVDEMITNIGQALHADGDLRKELIARYRSVTDDEFDKSPRQIMDDYRALNDQYAGQIHEVVQNARDARTNFLDQFRPKPQE